MEMIKKFIDFVGLVVYVVMFIFVGYMVWCVGWCNIGINFGGVKYYGVEVILVMIIVVLFVVLYFFGLMLNFGDFLCYCCLFGEVKCGNFWGLLVNFFVFLLVMVIMMVVMLLVFGELIIDLVEMVGCIDYLIVVIFGVLMFMIVMIGINIVVNFVLFVFDFLNVVLCLISWCVGGMFVVVVLIFIMLWNLFNNLVVIYYMFDVFGVFIGLLYGVLIVDFYFVKCGCFVCDDLYMMLESGSYWYMGGVNCCVFVVLLLVVVIVVVCVMVLGW